MKSWCHSLVLRLAANLAAVLLVAAPVHAQIRWDMASAYKPSNFHTENILQFIHDVDKATDGKLKITLYPDATRYKMPEIKPALQSGTIQAGEIILSAYSSENPVFAMDSVPFLANSYYAARNLASVQKPSLESALGKQGIKLLFMVPWPPQGIYSKAPISNIGDLKGIKWRAYNPQTSRIAELVGAQSVTVQQTELSNALASGAIAAFMTSPTTGVESKVWEQIRYYIHTQAWLPKNAVLVSQKAFDALDKETQEAVLKAAAEAEKRGWKKSSFKTDIDLGQLSRNGIDITMQPSGDLDEEFRKIGNTMTSEWIQSAGTEGRALLDQYHKLMGDQHQKMMKNTPK